jgi:antitoxin (DNA-binding transcriptional repressor) of toxin-antitoxin stability system
MNARVVDLRYKSKQILQAVDRNETVYIYYRGKLKAQVVPPQAPKQWPSVMDDPYFGCRKGDKEPVEAVVRRLRKPRYAV